MDTRQTRKRRWTTSPEKRSVRTSLDFENTPPRKKIRDSSTESDEEESQITIKSFYGGREKKSFPHSPGRKKRVSKIRSKLDEDEDELLSLKKSVPGEVLIVHNKPKKDVFKYSSTSSESETLEVLKERNRNNSLNISKKVTPKINGKSGSHKKAKTVKNSPKIQATQLPTKKNLDDTSALSEKNSLSSDQSGTPVPGRKFFKSKSPASASKCLGSVVISKGFNLKFLPKRRSMTYLPRESPSGKTKVEKAKEVHLDSPNRKSSRGVLEVFNDSSEKDVGSSFDSGIDCKLIEQSSQCSPRKAVQNMECSPTKGQKPKSPSKSGSLTPLKRLVQNDGSPAKSPRLRSKLSTSPVKIVELTPTKTIKSPKATRSPRIKNKTDDKVSRSPRRALNKSPAKKAGSSDTLTPNKSKNLIDSQNDTVSIDGSADLFADSDKVDDLSESDSVRSGPIQRQSTKYFPIFSSGSPASSPAILSGKSLRSSPRHSPRLQSRLERDHKEQMVLDAGQKKFGAIQCEVCGMVYRHADPGDESTHSRFHHDLLNILKFPGWKKERVVQEFPEDCSRIIMVLHDDPKYAVKKIEDINALMGREMGFPEASLTSLKFKAFLFISESKRVEGCCIAEPVTKGYRVMPDSQPSQDTPQPGHRPWYCHSEPEFAAVGISRIWVFGQQRRSGIATKLLDAVRQWFQYGSYIEKDQVAFSDPTSDGKQFASKYTGTPEFLVYKYT